MSLLNELPLGTYITERQEETEYKGKEMFTKDPNESFFAEREFRNRVSVENPFEFESDTMTGLSPQGRFDTVLVTLVCITGSGDYPVLPLCGTLPHSLHPASVMVLHFMRTEKEIVSGPTRSCGTGYWLWREFGGGKVRRC